MLNTLALPMTQPPQNLLLLDVSGYDPRPLLARTALRKQHLSETVSQPDWIACVERVAQERCRDSFMQLFEYYAPRISTYLCQQGASTVVAEELAQEAMLSLWRKADMYDSNKAAVGTWLFRIARNHMIDQLRRERRMAYDDDVAGVELVADDEAPAASDAAVLRRKVSELPEAQIDLVYKSYFEGKSHGEIAAETGQPLGSVKSRLRAALHSLRRNLDAEAQ